MHRTYLHLGLLLLVVMVAACPVLAGETVHQPSDRQSQSGTQQIAAIIGGGDINANATAFEVADAIMFANYFASGLAAFEEHLAYSVAQSDVNGDGLTLTMADWVMLYRVIVGDTIPESPPLPSKQASAPIHFTYDSTSGVFSLASATDLAVVIVRVPGTATVTPLVALPGGMGLDVAPSGGGTAIFLMPNDYLSLPAVTAGPLFQIDTHPVINSVEAADWSGQPSAVSYSYQSGTCCVGSTGDVNSDGNRNLTDLTLLVNSLFVDFVPVPCLAAGNTSGDAGCEISLTDLTALVNMLFVNFEPVANCAPACE